MGRYEMGLGIDTSENPLTCNGIRESDGTIGSVRGPAELEDLCLLGRGGAAEGKGMREDFSGGGAFVGGRGLGRIGRSLGIGGAFFEGLERLLNFL